MLTMMMASSLSKAALLLCSLFFKEGSAQVDPSKALIWSTLSSDGVTPALQLLYGDPQIYVTAAMNASDLSYYSWRNVTSKDTRLLEFGVLDTLYSTSTLFFYSTMNIFLSSQFIPRTGPQYSYLHVVALSNQITGISVDWVSGLVYWADALYRRICILDIATFGVWRSVVETNLTSPQDVVVYPQQSYVFWSDLGDTPRIERLDLKTDDRRVLSSSESLSRPTKLAVDAADRRLFWLDASATAAIGSMDFDGSGVSRWTLSAFSTVSSFALYQNYIFMGSSMPPMIVHIYDRNQKTYITNITGNDQSVVDITMWSPERQPNVDSPCSVNNGGCNHFCVTLTSSTRRCLCGMGFFLASNGTGCITKPMKLGKFLMMSDRRQKNVFQIDVDTGEVRALTTNQGAFLTAMTFDPLCNCFYHFDSVNRIVKRTAFDNSYIDTLFYATGMDIISLAVDSAGRILFYVDQNSKTISMFQLSTKVTTTFLSEPGSQPTAIVLDLTNGFLYWSDCGRQTIERSSMTNANSNRMSTITGLTSCVNAFAIDSQNGVVYWGDSGGSIATSRIDGSSRSVLVHRDQSAAYTGLTLDSRFLYIADSNKKQIQRLDRTSFQFTNLTRILFTQPYSILYYTNETVKTSTTSTVTSSASSSSSTTTTTATTTTTTTTTTTAIASSAATTAAIASAVIATSGVSSSSISSSISSLGASEGRVGVNVIILASVISGAAVLIAVSVAIAVIAYKKCRSRPRSGHDPVNDADQPPIHHEAEYNTIWPQPITPRNPLNASPAYESLDPYSRDLPSYYAELDNRAYEHEDGEQQ